MKKTWKMLMACLLAVVLLAGALPVLSEGEVVTLKYTMWDVSLKELEEETVIKPFEEANPDIKIDFQPMPWDEYWKKIQVTIAADDPYDVFYMSIANMWEYAHKGMIMNLQPIIDADPDLSDMNAFYSEVFDAVRYPNAEGDVYEFPYAWVCSLLYYNKDMFDAAGLEYPTDEWTYDEVMEAAKILTTGEGPAKQYGFKVNLANDMIDSYITAAGGHILNPDFSACVVDQPESVAALQELYDMIYVDGVSPTPMSLQGQPDPFLSGRVAMTVSGSYNIDTYRAITDFDWDVAMVPANADTGERVVYGGPDGLSIASNCKHPEEALRFLKYYCVSGRDVSSYMGGKVPISKAIGEDEAWLEKELKPANKAAILKSVPYLKGCDFSYKWSEWFSGVFTNEMALAFDGQVPIEDACETIVTDVNKILAEVN